jgi:hypothetical protein
MNTYATLREAVEEAAGMMLVRVGRADLINLLADVDALRAAAPPKKTRAKKVAPAAAGAGVLPDWLPLEAWHAFLDMRKKIKKPATDYAQTLLIKKLTAFRADDKDPGVILNQSIMNGWQDLYAPKDQDGYARGFDSASGRATRVGRPPVAEQNAANNAEALRLLGQPMFGDDGMTIEATR